MTQPLACIAVLDTETTGLPPDAALVEVGRTNLRLFPEGWRIESGPFQKFVDPGRPIPYTASAKHHIVDTDVAGAMAPADAIHWATVGADYVAAHNWEFDRQFITGCRVPAICTLKGAREVWPDLDSHSNQALRYFLGICQSREERFEAAHRAGFDTLVTAHILLELLNHLPVERLVEISRQPSRLARMPFGKHKGLRFSELPWDYLDWATSKSEMGEDIKFSARCELQRRRSS